MFEKVLVANRGEIAVRIIRACKELNIRTVAVYSEADVNSMHVHMADEAICIGKGASSDSYLRIDRIISAVAIAGGGGRGMRVAHNDISLVKGFHTARSEAEKAFGNSAVYIEKFIENPHHIEFQIVGDARGNIIHLGERDCSIQRRNQKIVEETPSPLIENKFKDLRKKMGKAAIRLAEVAKYTNAGTVEFIVDNNSHFYSLEVNKRIQVEHPITEEVTGIDLVRQQILIAMGEPLRISDVTFTGHAIECRINAEDPFDDFRPCPGRIEMY